jgi:hypothetical protein
MLPRMKKFHPLYALTATLLLPLVAPGAAPDESINLAFDRQKGKIYAAYSKTQREQPGLKGRVDLEFTVSALGKGSGCRVVYSEVRSPQLEARLCEVIETMAFGARQSPMTVVKRIDFFPALKSN